MPLFLPRPDVWNGVDGAGLAEELKHLTFHELTSALEPLRERGSREASGLIIPELK